MIWRRGRWLFLVAIAVVVVGVGYYALRPPDGQLPLQETLAAEAERLGPGQILVLQSVADFEWDHVHVFDAYSTLEDVRAQLGFAWSPMSALDTVVVGDSFLGYEGRQLLVFVADGQRVLGWGVLNELAQPPLVNVRLRAQSEDFRRDQADFRLERTGSSGWQLTPLS
jgi:hypothetical protein